MRLNPWYLVAVVLAAFSATALMLGGMWRLLALWPFAAVALGAASGRWLARRDRAPRYTHPGMANPMSGIYVRRDQVGSMILDSEHAYRKRPAPGPAAPDSGPEEKPPSDSSGPAFRLPPCCRGEK